MENVLRHLWPTLDDRHLLSAMRISIFVFAASVLTYAIASEGSSIYEMVSDAYQVTLVGSFVPLTFGLYWKRATTQGALASIILGITTWALLTFIPAPVRISRHQANMSQPRWPECWPVSPVWSWAR